MKIIIPVLIVILAAPAAKSQPLAVLDGSSGTSIMFSADGKRLLTAGGRSAREWDAQTFKPITEPISHDATIRSAVLSPDGKRVLTAAGVEAVVWDADSGKRSLELKHADRVFDVAFGPDGKTLATACIDKFTRVWDATSGKMISEMKHPYPVRSVSFNTDGSRLLVGTVMTGIEPGKEHWTEDNQIDIDDPQSPGNVHVWDLTGGREVWSKLNEKYFHLCCGRPMFTPNGRQIGVPLGWYGAVICDAETGEYVAEWSLGVTWGYFLVDFSGDGSRFLIAGRDQGEDDSAAARVLTIAPGPYAWLRKSTDKFHFDRVNGFDPVGNFAGAAISPDGKTVALASKYAHSSSSAIWDVATGKVMRTLAEGDAAQLASRDEFGWYTTVVRYSPDGTQVAVAQIDKPRNWRKLPAGTEFPNHTTIWGVPHSANPKRGVSE